MMIVSLVRCKSHYDCVYKSLEQIINEIAVIKTKNFLIKPNFVSVRNRYATTHVDAIKAFIDFVYDNIGSRKIIVAEAPAGGSLEEALDNFGYKILKEYGVDFIDLNEDDCFEYRVYDKYFRREVEVRIAKTVLKFKDSMVSICRPKTHDTVVVTLSLKNIAVGIIKREDKWKIHQGYGAINATIARLALDFPPRLAIIDGHIGMEGDGPVYGMPKKWGVGVAGLDGFYVDVLTTWMMGFDPKNVGYLYVLSKMTRHSLDVKSIKVVGAEPEDVKTSFKPHRTFREQLKWKNEIDLTKVL